MHRLNRVVSNLFNYVTMDGYLILCLVTAAQAFLGAHMSIDTGAIFHVVNEYTSQFAMTNKDVGDFV